MNSPQKDDRAVCADCKQPIEFIDPYWDHIGDIKPGHPATPVAFAQEAALTKADQHRLRLATARYELGKFILFLWKTYTLSIPETVTILLDAAYSYQKEESKKRND